MRLLEFCIIFTTQEKNDNKEMVFFQKWNRSFIQMRVNLMEVFNLPLLPILKQEVMARLYFKISLPCLFWVILSLLAEVNFYSVRSVDIILLCYKELSPFFLVWLSPRTELKGLLQGIHLNSVLLVTWIPTPFCRTRRNGGDDGNCFCGKFKFCWIWSRGFCSSSELTHPGVVSPSPAPSQQMVLLWHHC